MSVWDNVKKITQPYADDDYDDYDDDDYEDGYDDEPEDEPVRRAPSSRRSAPAQTPVSAPAPSSRSTSVSDRDDDFGFGSISSAPVAPAASTGFSGRVVNSSGNKQEVVLFRPGSFNDTSKAADDLKASKAVIVNMENVDKALARRVVDFLSGCVYAQNGKVKKIAQSAYLFCPSNVEVVGDLEAVQTEVESYV